MAWNPDWAIEVWGSFRSYCRDSDRYRGEESFKHELWLEHLIDDWVGDNPRQILLLSGGDYATYLEMILLLIEEYGRDQSLVSYDDHDEYLYGDPVERPRKISRLFLFQEWGSRLIDRQRFQERVIRYTTNLPVES